VVSGRNEFFAVSIRNEFFAVFIAHNCIPSAVSGGGQAKNDRSGILYPLGILHQRLCAEAAPRRIGADARAVCSGCPAFFALPQTTCSGVRLGRGSPLRVSGVVCGRSPSGNCVGGAEKSHGLGDLRAQKRDAARSAGHTVYTTSKSHTASLFSRRNHKTSGCRPGRTRRNLGRPEPVLFLRPLSLCLRYRRARDCADGLRVDGLRSGGSILALSRRDTETTRGSITANQPRGGGCAGDYQAASPNANLWRALLPAVPVLSASQYLSIRWPSRWSPRLAPADSPNNCHADAQSRRRCYSTVRPQQRCHYATILSRLVGFSTGRGRSTPACSADTRFATAVVLGRFCSTLLAVECVEPEREGRPYERLPSRARQGPARTASRYRAWQPWNTTAVRPERRTTRWFASPTSNCGDARSVLGRHDAGRLPGPSNRTSDTFPEPVRSRQFSICSPLGACKTVPQGTATRRQRGQRHDRAAEPQWLPAECGRDDRRKGMAPGTNRSRCNSGPPRFSSNQKRVALYRSTVPRRLLTPARAAGFSRVEPAVLVRAPYGAHAPKQRRVGREKPANRWSNSLLLE